MKISLVFLLCFSLTFFLESQQKATYNTGESTAEQDRTTAVTNVNLIPMTSEEVLEGMTVVIRGDRIVKVGPYSEVEIPDGSEIIEADGNYLIPGLAEMHGHIPSVNGGSNLPERYLEDVLLLYLAGGITTVRGMLGHPNQLELREGVREDRILGPNLYLAGPSFSGNSIQTPEEAIERVHQQADQGWDLLKVHPGLTLEEFKAMAEAAKERNIAFAGHIPEEVGLENAVRLGQETIDHLDGYIAFMDADSEPVREESLAKAVKLTKEHDVWVVPTQALWETLIGAADHEKLLGYDELKYMPPQVVENWKNFLERRQQDTPYYVREAANIHAENRQKLLKALQDGGVGILLGTDAPQLFSVPGFSLRHELQIMEEAGLTPFEILVSGTRNVGRYFSDKDNFGTIEEGSRADLILLPANPLSDLSVIERHNGIFVRGHWISREQIDQKLDEIEQAYSRSN